MLDGGLLTWFSIAGECSLISSSKGYLLSKTEASFHFTTFAAPLLRGFTGAVAAIFGPACHLPTPPWPTRTTCCR
jgi:hypothetical protein